MKKMAMTLRIFASVVWQYCRNVDGCCVRIIDQKELITHQNCLRYLCCVITRVYVMNVGALLTMQSENQVHVLSAGDSLALDCDFHADHFNLFDYPVLWRKTQAGKMLLTRMTIDRA